MKTMFKVMAERADYEGRHTYYDLKIGMANTLEQAHEMAEAKVREYNPTHETGEYQVTECTMDEATFTYTEKVVFTGYTKAVAKVMQEREIKDLQWSIEYYTKEIQAIEKRNAKRAEQGKEPTRQAINDMEYYQERLTTVRERLNAING
jgi:hypothetical protein